MRAQAIGNRTLEARIPAPFAALMRSLRLHGAEVAELRELGDHQWRELLGDMDRARVTLPFARLGYQGLPVWVQKRIESNLADTARHWEIVRSAYREAAARLDADGVEYLVLKGFTQAPDYVSRPELRRQGDIDFYVPRQQIPIAVRALREIGYGPCQSDEDFRYADHVPTLVRFGNWKWNGDIYDPKVPPAVEVHFCLWNDEVSMIGIREFESFWGRREVRALEDLSFPALSRVDHLAYFAMHILRDVFSASSVHHLRELGAFLDRYSGDDTFWKEWTSTHSPRLRSMQAIAFSLAVAWFSCEVSGTVQAEIDSLPERTRAWIRICGGTSLDILFRRTRDGRLLQYLLADVPNARRRILSTALAPGRIAGPETVATYGSHPSNPRRKNRIGVYLSYPFYLLSRTWRNGRAVVRFLAHACMVYFSTGRQKRVLEREFGPAPRVNPE